jgi:hypothetical protein
VAAIDAVMGGVREDKGEAAHKQISLPVQWLFAVLCYFVGGQNWQKKVERKRTLGGLKAYLR